MLDSLSQWISSFFLILSLFCVFSLILTAVVVYWFWRQISNFTSSDVPEMMAEMETYLQKNPRANKQQFIKKVIRRQSMKAGVVGALTGLGGFWTLPIALPADILISMRIQSATVDFIARAYGHGQYNAVESRVRDYLITTGGISATRNTTNMMTRFALRVLGKSFSKLIPFISAVISFVVNYSMARAGANVALKWYSNQPTHKQIPPQTTV